MERLEHHILVLTEQAPHNVVESGQFDGRIADGTRGDTRINISQKDEFQPRERLDARGKQEAQCGLYIYTGRGLKGEENT